jgi:hypothetical protein
MEQCAPILDCSSRWEGLWMRGKRYGELYLGRLEFTIAVRILIVEGDVPYREELISSWSCLLSYAHSHNIHCTYRISPPSTAQPNPACTNDMSILEP